MCECECECARSFFRFYSIVCAILIFLRDLFFLHSIRTHIIFDSIEKNQSANAGACGKTMANIFHTLYLLYSQQYSIQYTKRHTCVFIVTPHKEKKKKKSNKYSVKRGRERLREVNE